jgi:RPA family protein
MKRETAWRIFAGEYNDATFEIKGEGEMKPSYVVTPLGAKVNRVFIIGVLTDVENISEGGDLVRAHVSDPTGVFTIYSGSYQKEVTDALANIEAPAFVAIVGKVRTYIPEEGTMYVSIRPERIMEVDANTRDKWILETCKNTKDRIEAIFEAMKMDESNENTLKKLGFSKELSEGIIYALKNYKDIDLNKYVRLIQESLQYLIPGKESLPEITKDEKLDAKELMKEPEEKQPTGKTDDPKVDNNKQTGKEKDEEESTETENTVLEIIKNLEGDDGAAWDTITEKCEKKGLDKDTVEEALTSLMDKGLIYEPVLGTIKTT